MNNFWTWLKSRHYGESIIFETLELAIGNIPKQMIIGYMIEYLNERKFSYNLFSLLVDYCYLYLKCLIECYGDLIEKNIQ